MQTKIPCRKCKGSGEIEMPNELKETLAVVKKLKSADSIKVAKSLGMSKKRNAVNNRLEDLRAIGMLDRKRDGKSFFYFIP